LPAVLDVPPTLLALGSWCQAPTSLAPMDHLYRPWVAHQVAFLRVLNMAGQAAHHKVLPGFGFPRSEPSWYLHVDQTAVQKRCASGRGGRSVSSADGGERG
jgi:hypothetical protein